MKYLSTVILLSCSMMTLSTASADDGKDRCSHGEVVDVVTGVACAGQKTGDAAVIAGHDIEAGAIDVKNKLMPGIVEAKIISKTAGDVVIDAGKSGRSHLHAIGQDLAEPWDFSNLHDEKNQDAAHAVGDVSKGIGQDAKKIGVAFWHGLKKIGGGTKNESVIFVDAEKAGFKDAPAVDVVTALKGMFKGSKIFAVRTKDQVVHEFEPVGDEFQEKYHSESEKERIKQEDKKLLHDLLLPGPGAAPQGVVADQGFENRKPLDRAPAVVGNDLNGVEAPAVAAPAVDPH